MLQEAKTPVSGTDLARHLGVSRQVIVQDIALLRAVDKNILSTNKGYVLYVPESESGRVKRSFAVIHNKQQIQDELYTIVDYGGKVLDKIEEKLREIVFVKWRHHQKMVPFFIKLLACVYTWCYTV